MRAGLYLNIILWSEFAKQTKVFVSSQHVMMGKIGTQEVCVQPKKWWKKRSFHIFFKDIFTRTKRTKFPNKSFESLLIKQMYYVNMEFGRITHCRAFSMSI